MAHDPSNYRHVKLVAADNGGFILEYDEMGKDPNRGSFEGKVFLGTRREIFDMDEGKEALSKLLLFSGASPVVKVDEDED